MDDAVAPTKHIEIPAYKATPLNTATMLLVDWLIEHTKTSGKTDKPAQSLHDELVPTPLPQEN